MYPTLRHVFAFLLLASSSLSHASVMTYTFGFNFGTPVSGQNAGIDPGVSGSFAFDIDTATLPTTGGYLAGALGNIVHTLDLTILGHSYLASEASLSYSANTDSLKLEAGVSNPSGHWFQMELYPGSGDLFSDGPAPGFFASFFCVGTNLNYSAPGRIYPSQSCGPHDTFSLAVTQPGGSGNNQSVPEPTSLLLLGLGMLGLMSRRRFARFI